MSGFSSLNTAMSGLYAAQAGLYVTGHNVSNIATPGYSRQQAIQTTFSSMNIGYSGKGMMQVGLGTDIAAIRQVRNTFLDVRYREAAKRASFHSVKVETGYEIQSILGELEGDYVTQKIIQDMRDALNELTLYLPGLDTRGNFITTAVSFVTKFNNIYNRITEYQENLNEQVVSTVHEVNKLTAEIAELNSLIASSSASGDRPNDYIDRRNLALDELSSLVSAEVYMRHDGMVDVLCEGQELVFGGMSNKLGLRYTSPNCGFVEPVFTTSTAILQHDSKAKPLYKILGPVDALHENDYGSLKGLLCVRGSMPVNYNSPEYLELQRQSLPPRPIQPTLTIPTEPVLGSYGNLGVLASVLSGSFGIDITAFANSDWTTLQTDINNALTIAGYTWADLTNELNLQGGFTWASFQTDWDQFRVDLGDYITDLTTYQTAWDDYRNDLNNYQTAFDKYLNDKFNIEQAFIPRILIELDTLFYNIVKMINEACAPAEQPPTVVVDVDDGMGGTVQRTVPNAPFYLDDPNDPTSALIKNPAYTGPYALDKETQGIEVFSRGSIPRFGIVSDGAGNYEYGFIPEGYIRDVNETTAEVYIQDPSSPPPLSATMYTLGNVVINPVFSTADGYTKLCYSYTGDIEDQNCILDLLDKWTRNFEGVPGTSVETAYKSFVLSMATEAAESETVLKSQMDIVNDIDSKRSTISGVSLDEEMTSMMKFQHAYNSASRMLTILDSMIDTVVNRLGAGRG